MEDDVDVFEAVDDGLGVAKEVGLGGLCRQSPDGQIAWPGVPRDGPARATTYAPG